MWTLTINDLDAWRRVCLSAYENLRADTTVTMAQVDAILLAGAREAAALDMATAAGAARYEQVIDRVIAEVAGVSHGDVDAVLTQCAEDAAPLIDCPD